MSSLPEADTTDMDVVLPKTFRRSGCRVHSRPRRRALSQTPPRKLNTSPFFTKLPPEIRRQILEYAFGGATLSLRIPIRRDPNGWPHIHHPRDLFPPGVYNPACECALVGLKFHFRDNWTRNEAGNTGSGYTYSYFNHEPASFDDESDHSHVGRPFGWLKSCRQAYVEGIKVLYATNTFCMDPYTCILFPWLGAMLPQRLSDIRSLQISWCGPGFEQTIGWDTGTKDAFLHSRAHFIDLLTHFLPKHYLNLRHLIVAIEAADYFEMDLQADELEQEVLGPVDALCRALPIKCNLSLVLPAQFFHGQATEKRTPLAWTTDTVPTDGLGELWRPVQPLDVADKSSQQQYIRTEQRRIKTPNTRTRPDGMTRIGGNQERGYRIVPGYGGAVSSKAEDFDLFQPPSPDGTVEVFRALTY